MRAMLLFLLFAAAAEPVRGQGEGPGGSRGIQALWLPWLPAASPPAPDTIPKVDVEARFAAFQRDFEADFGRRDQRAAERRLEELGERVVKRLTERFEGSPILGWYQGGMRLYERVEGLYDRIEGSTRWASGGFQVDTEVTSVVDGRVEVHVEKKIHGFRLGMDLKDATAGRVGLRFGGVLRGYHVSLDVGDIASGQLNLRLKKRLE